MSPWSSEKLTTFLKKILDATEPGSDGHACAEAALRDLEFGAELHGATPMEKSEELLKHVAQVTMPVNVEGLEEALYTVSEGRGWSDEVDSVSTEQCLQCYRIVQWLLLVGSFPTKFKV